MSVRIFAVIALTVAIASTARGAEIGSLGDTALPVVAPGVLALRLVPSLAPAGPHPARAAAPQVVLTLASNPGTSFQAQHPLLGRISANIERAGLSAPTDPGTEPLSFTETRNRGVLRAAKKALKGFILEDMELYHRDSASPASASGADSGAPRAVRVRFGVSHLAPKIDLRCAAGGGSVGFTLNARGSAGIDIASGGAGNARVQLGYDHRSKTSAVAFRLAF